LIQAHWFSPAGAVYLGAANLAGYLAGAVLGRPIGARFANVPVLRAMMALVSAAFFACAFPISVIWFFIWRFLSGVAGGVIMVLVAATVLPHVPDARKGIASGAIFIGIGFGVAASGTLVPLLIETGLRDTWIGLGVLSSILTVASWMAWPDTQVPVAQAATPPIAAPHTAVTHRHIALVYVEYALIALGLVPPMVFLVDFAVRELGAGAELGSFFWVLYGLGAILGPPVYGFLADRFGARMSLHILLLVQAVAETLLALSGTPAIIGLLSIVAGSFPPGMVPLFLAWIRETMPGDPGRQNAAWSRATTVFAAAQALGAYGYSAIFSANGGDHRMLFAIGAGVIAFALAVDMGSLAIARKRR
jgi:predicted MFS family arabinose efflux permease